MDYSNKEEERQEPSTNPSNPQLQQAQQNPPGVPPPMAPAIAPIVAPVIPADNNKPELGRILKINQPNKFNGDTAKLHKF
ncbi:hypothetical protein MKX08_003198 [Trichoderma sp. CBMAI-0020]|nr:hypothetical protein MKX08_003198 [Trichoderma sp. CBMAI-0020]